MTVREYYLAAEKGVFQDDERLELLQGEVVRLSPRRSLHALAVSNLAEELRSTFPSPAYIRTQMPLALDLHNEPEPDVCVVRGPRSMYADHHPNASDCFLVVEVSETSLKKDVGLKAALYAEFGIPEYWVLDLKGGRLLVFRDPVPGKGGKAAYATSEVHSRDDTAVPTLGNGKGFQVQDLLPE